MMPIDRVRRKLVFALTCIFIAQPGFAQNAPNTVFVNGKILTVDLDFSIVQALVATDNEAFTEPVTVTRDRVWRPGEEVKPYEWDETE